MGKPRRRRSDRAGRAPMRSPGRPGVARREDRQRFWAAIADGLPSDRAGVVAGVSPAVGVRWFREYVRERVAGVIAAPDGTPVPGPAVRWIGRRHGRRKDRRWGRSWSPEQIANRLRVDFPDDDLMRISHEAIYQALYIQGRGAL